MTTLPNGYPADLEGEVATTDGGRLRVRPITPADGPGLVAFHATLSPWSVYLRYFGAHPTLSARDVERFTTVDYRDRLALVVEDGDRLVAVGRYDRLARDARPGPEARPVPGAEPGPAAEVAFVVSDRYQHHGIATVLLERLAHAARRNGITEFVADALAENRGMLDVFFGAGFPVTTTAEHEIVHVRFPIDPTPAYVRAVARRHAGGPGLGADGPAPC